MSQDVMGAVYERFLAHKLFQSGGRIKVEDTDELRKKEGIYYTPKYMSISSRAPATISAPSAK
jgi:hypothetical protein